MPFALDAYLAMHPFEKVGKQQHPKPKLAFKQHHNIQTHAKLPNENNDKG